MSKVEEEAQWRVGSGREGQRVGELAFLTWSLLVEVVPAEGDCVPPRRGFGEREEHARGCRSGEEGQTEPSSNPRPPVPVSEVGRAEQEGLHQAGYSSTSKIGRAHV